MNAFECIVVVMSVICVLWSQSMFMAERIIRGKWRDKQHYAPLWIAITFPAYMSALWPVWRALP